MKTFRIAAAFLVAAALLCRSEALALTADEVNGAIDRGAAFLRGQQNGDGYWSASNWGGQDYRVGATALVALALLSAGVPESDPALRMAIPLLVRDESDKTYVISLKAMALAAADPVKYRPEIAKAAEQLIKGANDGRWSYSPAMSMWDNSNTQFAVLGLRAASQAGVEVPERIWSDVSRHFRQSQNMDGGWGYRSSRAAGASWEKSYGSMTCAGIASLYTAGSEYQASSGQCGKYKADDNIAKAYRWLAAYFDVTKNPGGRSEWYYYYMYALERVGVIGAQRNIGKHDWYAEGAAALIARQGADGSWKEDSNTGREISTAFALLFLAKGKTPALMTKLKWRGDWNYHQLDLYNLTRIYGQELGIPVAWQTSTLEDSLQDLLAAPILFISGRGDFAPQGAEAAKLRDFVEQGGFILGEALHGDEKFASSFRAALQSALPGYALEALPKDHEIYSSYYRLKEEERLPLLGLNSGCRLSVIFSPGPLSCEWDTRSTDGAQFRLGVNIAAYVTGAQPLRDKLDPVKIRRTGKGDWPVRRGAFSVGQIIHNGDWNPHARMWALFLEKLREDADVDVVTDRENAPAEDPNLFRFSMLYLIGHRPFSISPEGAANIREYLENGGFLLAEACCGSREFDSAFRSFCEELFPAQRLAPIPPDHELFSYGPGLEKIAYRPAVRQTDPDLAAPQLEHVVYNGRVVIVYSPWAIGCGVEGHPCPTCRGLEPEDAEKLLTKIVLYGMVN
ncbi:MAG TPA: DUF4159 domain-containing protein [Candidatus Brocadiia bacterium]|nr:DUF4159 domain-containing protein [Candidatus Brocadiia bacterium]